MKKIVLVLIFTFIFISNARWTEEKAWDWYNKENWSAGVNYIPAYAVNEIEMWSKFDLDAIDREIRWATDIGFTKFRTFLHIQPFIDNKNQFMLNIWKYLSTLKSYKAKAILVLFDDCWNANYHSGAQPEPIPGVHNSQWVQCPGNVTHNESIYADYVKSLINNFSSNEGVVMWDLYNEIGNSGHLSKSLPLAKKIFQWAR